MAAAMSWLPCARRPKPASAPSACPESPGRRRAQHTRRARPPGRRPQPVFSSRLLLVGLAGHPRVMSSYRIEGSLIDARQIGSAVRVVISSQPRLNFPAQPYGTTDAQRVAANQAVIRNASLDAWLPHYEETSGRVTTQVSLFDVSDPATPTRLATFA